MRICDTYCTGCGLCEQICPVNAIQWKKNGDMEHYRPYVELSKCIQCQKCIMSCPQNNPVEKKRSSECYAAWNNDSDVREKCSSGGIAAAIYSDFTEKKGYAVGTVLKNNEVHFDLFNSVDKIKDFRGSKYVQPHIDAIYQKVLEKLKEEKTVVFIGLPCQCAAMIQVAKKYRDKLLVIDLVCHGIPSEEVLHSHIDMILKGQRQSVCEKKHTAIAFRDPAMAVCLSLNIGEKNIYHRGLHEDEYMQAFITGNLFDESCYHCQYACEERISDLTIGDFWGAGKKIPLENKIPRPSLVLINTERGKNYWMELKKKVISEKRWVEEAFQGNEQLKRPSQRGNNREQLKQIANNVGWGTALISVYGKIVKKNYHRRKRMERIKKVLTFIGVKKIYHIFLKR